MDCSTYKINKKWENNKLKDIISILLMQEEKKEDDSKKIPVNDKSKEIKKYQTRSERKAALIHQLYHLIQNGN